MAGITFIDKLTVIATTWLQAINDHVYNDTPIAPATTVHGSDVIEFIQSGTGAVARTVQDKEREKFSLKDFAVVNATTDDTAAITNLLAAASPFGESIYANTGSALVTSLSNPYGVEFDGPGQIVKAITGGYQMLNTYADKNKYAIGHEYLYRVMARIAQGFGAAGVVKCFMYGDSTIAGGNGETQPFNSSNLVQRLMRYKGIPSFSVTNRGVGGTKIIDMNAIPDLSATTDLFIIKYGINDATNLAATRLETFKTDLRAKLAAIRGDANGTIANLSIILVGPNSTSDTPNNRDERWYEQLRGIYVQAARDYQCAYFDTYAYLKDSRGAAGLWMDNPYADGRAIHPMDSMQSWIWGGLIDWAFSDSQIKTYATNIFTNPTSVCDALVGGTEVGKTWLNSSLPTEFLMGITLQRAQAANGAPFDGFCMTVRQADSGVLQYLFGYALNFSKVVTRTAAIGTNVWNRWTGGVVAENLSLLNGWVNYGSSFGTPSASVSSDGYCFLKGMVKSGTVTAGTQIATLPTGMAPAEDSIHIVATSGGNCQIKVTSTGTVVFQTAGDATYTSLDGIAFKVA